MNFIKVKISLALALTFCWAILCFKPAYADADIVLGGSDSRGGLNIGSGYDYEDLTVQEQASTSGATIYGGGTATYQGSATGTDTIIDGGTVDVEGNAKLTNTTIRSGDLISNTDSEINSLDILGGSVIINKGNVHNINMSGGVLESNQSAQIYGININTGSSASFTGTSFAYNVSVDGANLDLTGTAKIKTDDDVINIIKNQGSLHAKEDSLIEKITLENGSIDLSDNAILLEASVTGNFSVSTGTTNNPSTTGGTIENLTVKNGGDLWLYNNNNGTGGAVSNVTVQEGGFLRSNEYDSDNSSYSILTADNITVEQGGSFTLSTNDSITTIKTTSTDGTEYTGEIKNNAAKDIYVGSGSTFTVKENGSGTNIVVEGGNLNVDVDGFLQSSTISGGIANIYGYAQDTTFNGTSVLYAQSDSTIENASFLDSANVNIDDYSSLTGTLTVGEGVTGLDVSKLFNPGTGLSDLTLTGGLNSIFASGIINDDLSIDHNLFLKEGSYATTEIKGWKNVNLINAVFTPNNNVILNRGSLNIDKDSFLFISGNIAVENGGINNSGTIDLVQNNNVGDSLIIDGNYTGYDGQLNLHVDISSAQADNIIIKGTASGSTSVYLTPLNEGSALRDDILFAQAGNTSGENVFNIYRVAGSYLQWDTVFKDNKWYASLKNVVKDGKYVIVPEAAAYYGLIDNTFIQTSSLGESLRNNIAISEYQKVPCRNIKRGQNKICRSNRPVFSGWLAPAATSVNIETPYVYDAEVNGFDAGLDLISNGYTKLGLLASYRQGKYNYEENGDEYEIMGTAETTINSYLAGAYLRHDSKNWSTILAGYAGKLDVDMSTDDDINTSTSGTTYGATLDISYIYNNIRGIRIEPGIRISYTAVELDAVEDNGGKTQEFDNASRTEFEAGIKFAKRWEFSDSRAEIFVKPSIIKIMDDTSDFILEKEKSLSAADDQTIAKLSAGISFDMTSSLSASLAGSYSMGNDYKNASGNLSVMYKF